MSRPRTLRVFWLVLLVLGMAGSSALGGWLAWLRAVSTIATQSADRLDLHALAVQRLIDRFRVLPTVLALDPELRQALSGPSAAIQRCRPRVHVDASRSARARSRRQQLEYPREQRRPRLRLSSLFP
jgi:C4-dicarboxylate-specific signal transduction histidine kinase